MIILGIETATERLGAALRVNGTVFERHLDARTAHCELLTRFIGDLTAEAGINPTDIGFVAVSRGPGSFTGLRIGIATAMGLAYALGIRVCPVDTLAALAVRIPGTALVCPLINAKRGEAYTALYRATDALPETIVPPAAVPVERLIDLLAARNEHVTLTGPAAELFGERIADALGDRVTITTGESALPSAASVATCGEIMARDGLSVNPAAVTPLYLRRSDAELARDQGCRPS